MPVQTQLQQRRGTAASWTSTNPTLAAGEIGFESDTNKFKIGTGSTAWASLPYAASTSPLTTKGDLYTYSTADARLAVGNNGETLVADSSTSTGLRYQGFMTAGKNKILNSDFSIWQRGTSFTSPTSGTFIADRWFMYYDGSGGTRVISQQTFTGDNPSGCNASYYLRWAQTVAGTGGSINAMFSRAVEDVRNFNGQTVTVSFWAKADAARTIVLQTYQEFGTGGSGAVLNNSTSFSVTTSWQRFSTTFTLASVSGKTITGNSSISLIMNFPINTAQTIDITGIQLEAGSVATAFQTATGTIQGELAACQRYYFRRSGTTNNLFANSAVAYNSTLTMAFIQPPVVMRTTPTSFDMANLGYIQYDEASFGTITSPILNTSRSTESQIIIYGTSSGMTAGRFGTWQGTNTGAYLGFSAEL